MKKSFTFRNFVMTNNYCLMFPSDQKMMFHGVSNFAKMLLFELGKQYCTLPVIRDCKNRKLKFDLFG